MPDDSSTRSTSSRLAVELCGLKLASPIVLLSGCVGFGEEYTRIEGFSNADVGAIVLKGTTLAPRLGNPAHRVWETPAGMLNAIGLQNIGVDAFVRERLPALREAGARVVANYPFGPRANTALNATLLSYGDDLNLGLNIDPAAVSDIDALMADIACSYEELLGIA